MQTSEQIDQIATALSAAQESFEKVVKGKTAKIRHEKGEFQYKYADLGEVIETVRPALSANGLAVSQAVDSADGKMMLVTRLVHKSGQFISGSMPVPFNGGDPKQLGSLLTYYRRYAYTAIIGVATEEDDDGTSANASQPRQDARAAKPVVSGKPHDRKSAAHEAAAAIQAPSSDFDPADEPVTVEYAASNGRVVSLAVDKAVQKLWDAFEADISEEAFNGLLKRNEAWMRKHANSAFEAMRARSAPVAA